MNKKTNGSTKVIILDIGYVRVAVPSEVALRKLLNALSECQIVDREYASNDGSTYWRADDHSSEIAFHRVPAECVHLDETKPDRDVPKRDAFDVPSALAATPENFRKALGLKTQALLLEDLR